MSRDSDLRLPQGGTQPFSIDLVDASGAPESLSGADRAAFTMREQIGGAVIFERDTNEGTLVIDVVNSRLVGSFPIESESDDLVPGSYLGQASIHFAGAGWAFTRFFPVRVTQRVAAKPIA